MQAINRQLRRQSYGHKDDELVVLFTDLEKFLTKNLHDFIEELPPTLLALKIGTDIVVQYCLAYDVFKQITQHRRILTVPMLIQYMNENMDFPLYITQALHTFGLDYSILDNCLRSNTGISLRAFIRKQASKIKQAIQKTTLFSRSEIPSFHQDQMVNSKRKKEVQNYIQQSAKFGGGSIGGTQDKSAEQVKKSRLSLSLLGKKEFLKRHGIKQDKDGRLAYDSNLHNQASATSFTSTTDLSTQITNIPPFLSTLILKHLNSQFYGPLLKPQGFLIRKSQKIQQKWSDCFWMYDSQNSVLRSWRPQRYILLRDVSEFNTSFFPSAVPGMYDAAILHHDHKLSDKYDPKVKFIYVEQMIDVSKLKSDINNQFQIPKQYQDKKVGGKKTVVSINALYKDSYLLILIQSDHPLKEQLFGRLNQRRSEFPHIFVPIKWRKIKSQAHAKNFQTSNQSQRMSYIQSKKFQDALLLLDKKGVIKFFSVRQKDSIPLKNHDIFSSATAFSSLRKFQFIIQRMNSVEARERSPKKWLNRAENQDLVDRSKLQQSKAQMNKPPLEKRSHSPI